MAAFSSIAAGIGALAAVGSGIAGNVQQNKARAAARHAMYEQQKQMEIDRANQQEQFRIAQADQARIHKDNMDAASRALASNRETMNAQLAQAQQGFELQQKAMQQQQADADRNFAIQKATLERGFNAQADKNVASFKRPDAGVAGTILTAPGGVEKNKLKLGRTSLLGGGA